MLTATVPYQQQCTAAKIDPVLLLQAALRRVTQRSSVRFIDQVDGFPHRTAQNLFRFNTGQLACRTIEVIDPAVYVSGNHAFADRIQGQLSLAPAFRQHFIGHYSQADVFPHAHQRGLALELHRYTGDLQP